RPRARARFPATIARAVARQRAPATALAVVAGDRTDALRGTSAAWRIAGLAANAVGPIPRGIGTVIPLNPAIPRRAVAGGVDPHVLAERNDRNVDVAISCGGALQ